jgi:hypothetical protein
MTSETCSICGGDGELVNSFGSRARCPGCHGTGRRGENEGFRDVTKTKPSHHQRPNAVPTAERPTWPTTHEGAQLAEEVKACAIISNETKAKLTREIIAYEHSHGRCTKTFTRKIRKQLRPAS